MANCYLKVVRIGVELERTEVECRHRKARMGDYHIMSEVTD